MDNFGDKNWIRSLTFSSSNKFLVSASNTAHGAVKSEGGSIKVWDLPESGRRAVALRFVSHIVGVRSVKLSPDDKYIAAGVFDDSSVRLLNAVTGQQIRVLEGRGGPVLALAWSPDGKFIVSTRQDGTALVERVQEFEHNAVKQAAGGQGGKQNAPQDVKRKKTSETTSEGGVKRAKKDTSCDGEAMEKKSVARGAKRKNDDDIESLRAELVEMKNNYAVLEARVRELEMVLD